MMILICGTSGSGKSKIAEDMLEKFNSEKKFYIATAKVFDSEMAERVKKHQAMRAGKNFITIEREKNLSVLEISKDSSVLVESLTTWLANEIFASENHCKASEKIFDDIKLLKAKCKNLIFVSDDIFSDGLIYDDATEFYRRTLAALMINIAAAADKVVECIAGLPWCYNHNYF